MNAPENTITDLPAESQGAYIIPTGSLRLDLALGLGGIPAGAIVEIAAPETCGKTTLCQHIIAEAQKLDGVCAFLDADRTFNANYARGCGVILEKLYYSEPTCARQAFEMLEILASSGAFAVVVVDSLSALVSMPEQNGSPGELFANGSLSASETDLQALSRSLRKLSGYLGRTGARVFFTSLTDRRMYPVYRQLATQPARLALKLHTTLRLSLSPKSKLFCSGRLVGDRVGFRVVKNRYSPCLQSSDFDIIHDQGINKTGEVFDLGVDLKIIQKQNDGFRFQSVRLGKTSDEAMRFLNQNLNIRDVIEQSIRQGLMPKIYSAAR